jgi:hypothetical protein
MHAALIKDAYAVYTPDLLLICLFLLLIQVQVRSNVDFRFVTPYYQIPSGPVTIGIRPAGAASSTPFSASANFTGAAGKVRSYVCLCHYCAVPLCDEDIHHVR